VPSTCPKQQSATVANGQPRSLAEVAGLGDRRMASSPTVLPKLAVKVCRESWDSLVACAPDTSGNRVEVVRPPRVGVHHRFLELHILEDRFPQVSSGKYSLPKIG
jgi:hypothetical protein